MKLDNILIKTIDNSSPSLYKLCFFKTNKDNEGIDQFSMNIHTSPIPGIDLDSNEVEWQGAKNKRPEGKINFSDWNLDFMVDENYDNWYYLYEWMTFINNNYDDFGKDYSKYTYDATLIILNNWKKEIMHIKFYDIWPQSLGEVNLSYRDGLSYLECNATFLYDRYVPERL